jgi:hypothetical protein
MLLQLMHKFPLSFTIILVGSKLAIKNGVYSIHLLIHQTQTENLQSQITIS